jgi:hypothetical protein
MEMEYFKELTGISIYSKRKKHTKEVQKLSSMNEKLKYIIDNLGNPKACHMIDFDTLEEFYYPQLGYFLIRRAKDGSCGRYKTAEEAVTEAKKLIRELKDYYENINS